MLKKPIKVLHIVGGGCNNVMLNDPPDAIGRAWSPAPAEQLIGNL